MPRLQKKALDEIAKMQAEAQLITDALSELSAGVKSRDAERIRKALDALADETYSYSGGIVGFRPRVDAATDLLERLTSDTPTPAAT